MRIPPEGGWARGCRRPARCLKCSASKQNAPRSRGAAAPTTEESARLSKEQPGDAHAHRIAHPARHPPGEGAARGARTRPDAASRTFRAPPPLTEDAVSQSPEVAIRLKYRVHDFTLTRILPPNNVGPSQQVRSVPPRGKWRHPRRSGESPARERTAGVEVIRGW